MTIKKVAILDVVVYTSNSSTHEAETGVYKLEANLDCMF